MPGTIRVSVLEFIDLPNPELLPSPISIKVSMGKRHYETSEKGDFSFPLTTLRDDVILVVQDAGGNEISRAGVQAKSIVEKGYWDDLFPLEGGGRVHLQLQFSLTDDDRSRIRMMRETALRRKQAEHQDRNLKSSGSDLASSLYLNPELSVVFSERFFLDFLSAPSSQDSQKSLLQIGNLSAKEAAHQSPSASTENIPDEKPVTEKTNNIQLDQIQPLSVENDADRNEDNPSTIELDQIQPLSVENDAGRNEDNPSTIELDQIQPLSVENDADRNEDNPPTIPLLQEIDVNKPKVNNPELVERKGTQSPYAYKPSPTIPFEEKLLHSQGSELPNASEKGEVKTLDFTEAPSLKKTPSNVKKVISAFESSLTQDTKPRIKPTLRNTQHSVVEKQTSLKNMQSKKVTEDDTKPTLSETTMDPLLEGELTRDLANIKEKEQSRKFIEALDGTRLSGDPRQSLKLKGEKNQVGGEILSEKDKMHENRDDIDANNDESYQNPVLEKPDYARSSVADESTPRSPTTTTEAKEVESVSCVKDEQFPSKRSGGWIFPDEGRRLCVTTGGNQMLDLVGGGRTSYTFNRKGEMKISIEENRCTSETQANGVEHNHRKMIKPESSDDEKASEGPLANALKIAMMIGFGTLVLLTRQRKKKK